MPRFHLSLRVLGCLVTCWVLLTSVQDADATVITFTELGLPNFTTVTTQYAAFGITVSNGGKYISSFDTFDGNGITNFPGTPGSFLFTVPTPSITLDFVVLSGNSMTLDAFDASSALLATFFLPTVFVATNGTTTLSGSNISRLDFRDSAGSVGISTLTFTPIPEPTTALLLASGLAAMAVGRRRGPQ